MNYLIPILSIIVATIITWIVYISAEIRYRNSQKVWNKFEAITYKDKSGRYRYKILKNGKLLKNEETFTFCLEE